MKTTACAAMAALLLGLTACNQAPIATGAETAPVTFEARPDLAQNVGALPRLVGEGAAIAAINADLDLRDTAAKAEGCDEGDGGYSRSVSQPMTGPDFVSFMITQEYACQGAAHPSFDQTAITYDLATGRAVDWVAVSPGLELARVEMDEMPADYVPGVYSPALSAWYSAKALASTDREHLTDCAELWSTDALESKTFKVWLDAQNGGVSFNPEFAHVAQACADTATLTAEEMRRFGVSPAIIDAVTAAHAAGSWAPKDE
ncbi:hypothetical protein [Brevundimonas sp. Root1423]|uniref:hypothetical protein n=1 Tax=Brevundimonas sp. Root1423 TaxID=1736462 RepID=UPI0006FEBFB5|nr:hypothetical protein [Brevundimonas sp. Root1423]KQY84806.1 hypothetical protein ASD25_07245 [Brevundimonas sp. Root1423]